MNGRQHETTGASRDATLHLRRPGAGKTLCGVEVGRDWKAWGSHVFTRAVIKCGPCTRASGAR